MKQREYQDEKLKEIKRLLSSIDKKSKAFHKKNRDTWFGDLGAIVDDLTNADRFLTDSS